MANKTIGGIYAIHGAKYFVKYCPHCKESIYWNYHEAKEFLQNASQWICVDKKSLLDIVRQKIPKIRVEWGSGQPVETRVLTQVLDRNIIESEDTNMKLKQKSQMTERTKKILDERSTGKSIVEIGKLYGLSRQRVFSILKQYGDTLPKELAEGCE